MYIYIYIYIYRFPQTSTLKIERYTQLLVVIMSSAPVRRYSWDLFYFSHLSLIPMITVSTVSLPMF